MVCITILLISVSCKQEKEKQTLHPFTQSIDSLNAKLAQIHKKGFINGFGVALVHKEGTLYENGFGLANLKTQKNYTKNTLQNIGSVSKTLIGVALLKAQELGKLNLDDPINKYLPYPIANPKFPNHTITIKHLATHTSSILDNQYYNDKAYILKDQPKENIKGLNENFNAPGTRISLVDFLYKMLSPKGEWYQPDAFSNNPPGTLYEYTNVGAALAGLVIEQAVGKSYADFTTEHILQPLQMKASGWSFTTINPEQHSTLYANPTTELPFYSLITYPDGGLITSVTDLAAFLTELIKGYSAEGTLLQKQSYAQLFTEQLTEANFKERDTEDDFDDEYNSGIFMGFSPKGYVGHMGGDPGIACYMFFNPKTNTGRILMINTTVMNSGGVQQFYDIWNTLGDFEPILNTQKPNK